MDLDADVYVDPALLEGPTHRAGGVCVAAGEDLGHRLEQGHRRAEVAQHRGELTADGATADDRHPFGHLGDRQQFVAGHDERPVDVEAGDRPWRRTGRQHDVWRLEHRRFASVDGHRVVDPQTAGPRIDGDLPAGEQAGEPLEQPVYHLLLALLADHEVDGGITDRDPELGGMSHGAQHRGRLEEFLGRDAAHVEAGATQLRLLDEADVEAGCRGEEGSGVAGRAPTDHYDVVCDRHPVTAPVYASLPVSARSSGNQDLDSEGNEDRHAARQGQGHQHPRAHGSDGSGRRVTACMDW